MTDSDRKSTEDRGLQEQANLWLRLLTSGAATDADVAALEKWRAQTPAHDRAFAETALLWDVLGDATKLAVGRNPAFFYKGSGTTMTRRLFLGGSALAAVSLAAVSAVHPPFNLWPSIFELEADYRTRTGERRHVDVTNAVSLEMNTQTSMNLRTSKPGEEAIELVTGEATVEKQGRLSSRFAVFAGNGRAEAEQASFNVKNRGGITCVTCIDGAVDVFHPNGTAKLLERQQVSYNEAALGAVAATDPRIVTAWQRGLLMFRERPLSEVVDEVNRYRPGKIILRDARLGRRQVVADFRLDRLDDVVPFISQAMNIPARTLPGGIVLLG